MDSKQFEISISVENIEAMREGKDGRLNLVYFIPDESGQIQKKVEWFECCENEEIIKTYESIRQRVEAENHKKGASGQGTT